jgi:hypothetical protein
MIPRDSGVVPNTSALNPHHAKQLHIIAGDVLLIRQRPVSLGRTSMCICNVTTKPKLIGIQTSHDSEPDMPAEDVRCDGDDTNTAKLSMEETLRKYIPDDSELAASIKQRESKLWVVGDSGNEWPVTDLDLDYVKVRFMGKSAEAGIILFIQDINLDWCKKLCEKYPKVLSPQILAEHVIRFDELPPTHESRQNRKDIEECLQLLYPNTLILQSPDFMSIHMDHGSTQSNTNGFHFDVENKMPCLDAKRFRQDVLSRDTSNTWKRISSRMTCVQLEEAAQLSKKDAHTPKQF